MKYEKYCDTEELKTKIHWRKLKQKRKENSYQKRLQEKQNKEEKENENEGRRIHQEGD